MEKYLPVLQKTRLFAGVSEDELGTMLHCLGAKTRTYRRGETVLQQGAEIDQLMILAEGKLHIQRDDYWGNRSIVNVVEKGALFGESYAAPNSGPLLNDVVAVADSTVVFLNIGRVLSVCPSGCPFHAAAVRNLFFILSDKNRDLVSRLGIATRRSIREKLIAYLSEQAKRQGSARFEIPFNRQQLADFLAVDRSALSSELGRMRDEGMLRFEKNRFELLEV